MAPQSPASLLDPCAIALSGTWKLAPGRAVTLQPRETGVLRVAHGQLWATYDGPHPGPLNDQGDRFIGYGEQLGLQAGQRLVLEPRLAHSAVYFTWEPEAAQAAETARRFAPLTQPLADLRLALSLAARATVRLLAGLAGLAWPFAVRGWRTARPPCRPAA